MTGADLSDFDQTRTIYPPWDVKFWGKKFSKNFRGILRNLKISIFAPYIRAKRPPHISQPTDDSRSGFIWSLVTPRGYSKFSKIFSKIFQNSASYGQNRQKTYFFESLKNQRVTKKFENFFLPCISTYMELSRKKKFGMAIFFVFEIFLDYIT